MKNLHLRKNLKGGLDLVLLLRAGMKAFDNDAAAARRSFLPLVVTAPLGQWFAYIQIPIGMDELPQLNIQLSVFLSLLIPLCLSYLMIYWFSGLLDARRNFFRLVSAANWSGTAYALLTLPFFFLRLFEILSWEDMNVFGVILACYGYVILSYVIFLALEIPLSLAIFVAICSMFISETFWDILYIAQGLPPPP